MKKHILIVDDERLILFGLTEALKTETLLISTAATAARTMEQIATSCFDLYILDLTLPDMDGLELAKNIESSDPDAKFIFMSGKYTNLEDLIKNSKEAAAIRPYDFITKPFEFDQVQKTVYQALDL